MRGGRRLRRPRRAARHPDAEPQTAHRRRHGPAAGAGRQVPARARLNCFTLTVPARPQRSHSRRSAPPGRRPAGAGRPARRVRRPERRAGTARRAVRAELQAPSGQGPGRLPGGHHRPAGHRRHRAALPGAAALGGQLGHHDARARDGRGLRADARRQAALLHDGRHRGRPRSAARRAGRRQAHARRRLLWHLRGRALRARAPRPRAAARARLGPPARRHRSAEPRPDPRDGARAARRVQAASLPVGPGRRPRGGGRAAP